jgi:phosphatidate cytidylyltransferase
MKTRIIVAVVAIPVVLTPIYLGGLWSVLLFTLIGLVGGYEFYVLMDAGGYRPLRWLGLVWLAVLVLNAWPPVQVPYTLILTAGLLLAMCAALLERETPIATWMSTSIVAIYLGLMIGQALALRMLNDGFWLLMYGVLLTWANDTMALFTGIALGRHKLWPRISPKKTWEGTVGGWISAAVVGSLLAYLFPIEIGIAAGAAVGLACGALALLGDLSISMVKRQIGVKDTGALFPGHGGMLDRLDSLLFVIPFVYNTAVFLA